MYRKEAIAALFGLVGFRQPTQADFAMTISVDNKKATSGTYFDWGHAAVTAVNILNVVNADPAIDNTNYNALLTDLQNQAIDGVLSGIFNDTDLIEQAMLITNYGLLPVVIENESRFVGFQITVPAASDISVVLNSISAYFTEDVTFNVYVFNQLQKAPVATIEVQAIADSEVVIVPTADVILNATTSTNKSRIFYVGYFQDDLGSAQAYNLQGSYPRAKCFSVTSISAATVTGGDPNFVRFTPWLNYQGYGLNLQLTSSRDYTEKIKQQRTLFTKAIALQMAATVIEGMIHSVRSNQLERMNKESLAKLYTDLNLDMATPELPYTSGLKNKLRQELVRLKKTFFPKATLTSETPPANDYICLTTPILPR